MEAYTVAFCHQSGHIWSYFAGHGPVEVFGMACPDFGTEPKWTSDPDLAAMTDKDEAERLKAEIAASADFNDPDEYDHNSFYKVVRITFEA